MSSGRNTVRMYLTITGAALLIGLLWFAPRPIWISFVLVVAFIAAVVLLVKVIRRSSSPPPEPMFTYAAALPVERREERITDVLLPSKHEDYYFLFSATVLWSLTRGTVDEARINMAALAVDAVLKRAQAITEQRDPGNASLVRHELGRVLGEMQMDAVGHLRAMAESVQLALPDYDQQRLDKLAEVRKDEAIWEHERKYEQSKRRYLGGDVLKDTGSAVIWWLAKNNDHVEKTVQDIGLLAQLSSAANNTDVPETFQRFVAGLTAGHATDPLHPDLNGSGSSHSPENGKSATDLFEAFMRTMDLIEGDPERVLFARRVADLAARHGRQEVADKILHRFDIPDGAEDLREADDGS